MKIGFKMLIYPTETQIALLKKYCRTAHDMWNFLVKRYENKLPIVGAYGVKDYSPRQFIDDFGEEVPQRIALGVLKTYSFAVQRFYKHIGNKPKFHKYNPNKQSFYVASKTCPISNGAVFLISTTRNSRAASKKIPLDKDYLEKYGITEVIEPRYTCYKGKWYLSGSYKVPDVPKSNKEFIGLDWGIKTFMTTSEGELINYPESVTREFYRIKKLQSLLNKKVKGSNNYNKLYAKLQTAYNKLENLKKDFIELKTTELCKDNSISVEALKGISRSKRFVRRQNMIYPRARFVDKLKWKCEKFGSYFVEVDPRYTSQRCCICGKIHRLTLKDRTMICDCGNILDRDINAAINIKNDALASMGICRTY